MDKETDPFGALKEAADKQYKRIQAKKTKGKPPRAKLVKKPKIEPPSDLLEGLSDTDLNALYDEVVLDRELGLRSMRDYARICWPIISPGVPYVEEAWHSDCLSDHFQAVVDGQIKRLLISVPPGFGKSLWSAVLFPSYAWCHYPHWKMVYGSYLYSLSEEHASLFIKLIKSKFWQQRWGDAFGIEKAHKSKVTTTMGGIRAVLSVKGQTLGFRADVAVADDPLNIVQSRSEAERATVHHWWMNGMMSRGNVNLRGIVICQRLHDSDLVGHLLDLGGWEYLCLPAEYVPKRQCTTYDINGKVFFKDPRKKEGELLFPKLFPASYFREREKDPDTGRYASALYQQDPVPEGGNIIKENWFRFYKESPEEVFSKCNRALLSADTAIKSKTTSSFTVLQIWGTQRTRIYLIDQLRMRLSFTGILEALQNMINKWNGLKGPTINAKLIEDKASGPDIIDTLQDKIMGLIPSEGNDDKEDRMHAITWLWEAGNVYVPGKVTDSKEGVDFSHIPWMQDWYDEITRYPLGKYTDQAMAMSQALMYIGKQMKTAVGIPTPVAGHGYMYNLQQNQMKSSFRRGHR